MQNSDKLQQLQQQRQQEQQQQAVTSETTITAESETVEEHQQRIDTVREVGQVDTLGFGEISNNTYFLAVVLILDDNLISIDKIENIIALYLNKLSTNNRNANKLNDLKLNNVNDLNKPKQLMHCYQYILS